MKKLFTVAAIITLMVSGCQQAMDMKKTENTAVSGQFSVYLEGTGGRSLFPTTGAASIANYQVTTTGSATLDSGLIAANAFSTSGHTFSGSDVVAGNYNVTVSGLNTDGNIIYQGTESGVTVGSTFTTPVYVTLKPQQTGIAGAEGSIALTLNWSGTSVANVDYILRNLSDSLETRDSLTPSGSSAVFTNNSQTSGNYLLTFILKDSDDNLLASVSEAVLVYDYQDTTGTITVDDGDFRQPPTAPNSLTLDQHGRSVLILWTDTAKTETGYKIYRTDDQSNRTKIADLMAAETDYKDSNPGDGDYTYEVVAFNEFGELSTSATITVAAPVIANDDAVTVYRGQGAESLEISANTLTKNDTVAGFGGLKITSVQITRNLNIAPEKQPTLTFDPGNPYSLTLDTSQLTDNEENSAFEITYTIQQDPLPEGAIAADYQDNAVVTFTVGTAVPPALGQDENFSVRQGNVITISYQDLLKNDIPNNNPGGTNTALKIVNIANGDNGITNHTGLHSSTGSLTFSSIGKAYDPANFTYTVENEDGDRAMATVSIRVTPLRTKKALIFSDRDELNAIKLTHASSTNQDNIFNNWNIFSENYYWKNREEAEGVTFTDSHGGGSTDPHLAWALRNETDGTPYLEYPLNTSPNGFISPTSYDNYTFEATLTSSDSDNDYIGLVAAFIRDDNGTPSNDTDDQSYVLAAMRYVVAPTNSLGLQYWGVHLFATREGFWGKRDTLLMIENDFDRKNALDEDSDGDNSGEDGSWDSRKARIRIERNGNTFVFLSSPMTASTDIPEVNANSRIEINLDTLNVRKGENDSWDAIAGYNNPASSANGSSDGRLFISGPLEEENHAELPEATSSDASQLERFKGEKPYGYVVYSQPNTSWKNVIFEAGNEYPDFDTLYYVETGAGNYSEIWRFNDSANSAAGNILGLSKGAWELVPNKKIQDRQYMNTVRQVIRPSVTIPGFNGGNEFPGTTYTIFDDYIIEGTP